MINLFLYGGDSTKIVFYRTNQNEISDSLYLKFKNKDPQLTKKEVESIINSIIMTLGKVMVGFQDLTDQDTPTEEKIKIKKRIITQHFYSKESIVQVSNIYRPTIKRYSIDRYTDRLMELEYFIITIDFTQTIFQLSELKMNDPEKYEIAISAWIKFISKTKDGIKLYSDLTLKKFFFTVTKSTKNEWINRVNSISVSETRPYTIK